MNLVNEGVLDPNEPDFRDEKREADEVRRDRETLADIVADLRSNARHQRNWACDNQEYADILDRIADRIEAAWKREKAEAEADALAVGGIVEAERHKPRNAAAWKETCAKCMDGEIEPHHCEYYGEPNGCNSPTYGEHPTVGNAAATYAALVKIHDLTNALDEECGVDPVEIRDIARAALAAPARQCDVGTAEEQADRFGKLCGKYYNEEEQCNEKCPLASLPITHGFPRCQAYWAQTPYEAKEGAEK